MNHARAVVLMLAVSASAAGLCAESLDECPAKKYKQCVTFNTSRTIQEHTPLIENALARFIRSKGSWKISVGYGPAETCAKVYLTVDMGPLDFHRTYERVFRNGTGVISDNGTFLHRVDEVESALRILTSRCRVPDDPGPERLDAQEKEHLDWEEERERLAWEAERERLALEEEKRERRAWEEERERLALEEAERERLAWEAERRRREVERQGVLAERARKQELERQRLARERQRLAEERARQLAKQQRERERIAQLQREQKAAEAAAQGSALNTIITGFGLGALVGSAITGDDEVFDAAASLLSQSVGSTYVPSDSYSSGDSGCAQIGERLARSLERLSGTNSMCTIYSGTAQAYSQARNELAATGCASSQELAGLDQAIAEARRGARSVCE